MTDEELVKRLRKGDTPMANHYMDEAADRIEALLNLNEALVELMDDRDAKLAKAVGALDSVMVGGNHLATILPDNFPPAETEPLIALETVGYGYDYEVWCCWRSIMLARTTLAELTGGKDE